MRNSDKKEIMEIIYKYSHHAGMSENMTDGQIIGFKTGKGFELEEVAEALIDYFDNRPTQPTHKK